MANRLTLDLAIWKAQFRAEPRALAEAARPVVQAAAQAAGAELRVTYHLGPTGNLRKMVRVLDVPIEGARARTLVISGAPHAHLYEYGTRYARAIPTFWPITNRHARGMTDAIVALLEARGYWVTGH